MFWGDNTLRARLEELITPYNQSRIEGASYRMSVGKEVFVSPTSKPIDPRFKLPTILCHKEWFTIPPGQFGFILTEEHVSVPESAIALISIRARYKFRGLVNVSGFHVDPGYSGRLMFSVFNSGPNSVHLRRGDECFLIWYAELDGPSAVSAKEPRNEIPSELTGPLSEGMESFSMLRSEIENLKQSVRVIVTVASALIPVALLGVALLSWSTSKGAPKISQVPSSTSHGPQNP